MKCVIPEISWHNREPVLCIDVHPTITDGLYKIATGGADYHILIWTGTVNDKGGICVEVSSDLSRHQKAVNALRWSPDGSMLASGDDDAIIFLWTLKIDVQEAKVYKESYIVHKILRGHKDDIYDLCWSPKGDKILTGSIDNSAILWDVTKGKCEYIFSDHKGFVQGVCWDPKGQFIATLSSDRVCRIIDASTKHVKSRIFKGLLPVPQSHPFYNKEVKYFHDDTFKSYFRRFGFSPDGNLFITPAGYIETDDNRTMKCAYVFTLHSPQPVGMFPFDNCCTLAAKFSSCLYELSPLGPKPFINLPYRMVFAIAAETDIFLYDTQQPWPFGRLKNVHYTRITDLSWSLDGQLLVASSSDGYCTLLSFLPGEIGELYVKEETEEEKEISALNISGIDELEPMETEEVKEIKEVNEKETPPIKKATFLLQWANKAREGVKVMNDIAKVNINEEKINVLTVKKDEKDTEKENSKEVIEIEDSPIKENEIPKVEVVENANVNEDVKRRIAGAKPIAIRRKPRQDSTLNKKEINTKRNSLLKFLTTSPEKKIRPILEDNEARDSWNCDDKSSNKKIDLTKPENDDLTVPDLDLKIENSTQGKIDHIVVLSDASNDSDRVCLDDLLKNEKEKSAEKQNAQKENSGEVPNYKKTPRRVSLITLSSPKHKKQKNT